MKKKSPGSDWQSELPTAGDVLQRRQIYKFYLDSDAIAIE